MMSARTYSLLRRMCMNSGRRTVLTAAAEEIQTTEIEPFRTLEMNPPNHSTSHLNKIYTMPSNIEKLLQDYMTTQWKKQAKIFAECGILIRQPALETISYLEQTDYTKSINKYVLYGINGVGKTTTLMHILHYGFVKKFIVFHVPWVNAWFRFPKEITNSIFMPDKLDLPIHAGMFLKYFRHSNASLLSELDLKVSKDYTWSQRESTKCGDPLIDLIEFGIQRIKFASGVIDALVNELKAASTAGKCRVLVAIDGFNALTADCTSVRDENKVYVPAERLSITTSLFNSVDFNWCNGAVVLTVDTKANKGRRDSVYPRYLLGKKGFEHLDPFLPICVENYTPDEFNTIIDYYKDRKWIRDITPEGQKELEVLSNRNPFQIWQYSLPL